MRVVRPLLASVLMVGLMGTGAASLPAAAVTPSAQLSDADQPECTIIGTSADDVLLGTPAADVLCGRGGDDVISGGGGDDVLRGGPGQDQLRGEAGDDFLGGGSGDRDDLDGGAGDDVLKGFDGADRLHGGKGRDLLKGGNGPDDADGGPGRDTVHGGASWDSLDGGAGSDSLKGGSGADRLDARDDSDFVDEVDCGAGLFDRARADADDAVAFTCEEYPDNVGPTDLSLSNSTLSDGWPAGTKVGVLSAVDPTPGDRLAFRLVEGAGAQDNGAFSIDGRRLLTLASAQAGGQRSYSVRVRVTDHWGARETKIFTISVEGAGTPPVTPGVPGTGVDDSATVTEDDAATSVDVLANDRVGDPGPLSIDSVTQPGNGTVTITGGGTGLTYKPKANYCNDGSSKDTFTYTLKGGSTATVSMTVTCVNDPSVAVDDDASVAEDAAPTAVDVLANDEAGDTGPLSIGSVTQPGDGTVVITGGGTGLTYQPDADYCNDGSPKDTFTYTLDGGPTAKVAMTVTCEDDAPIAVDDSKTVTEDAAATEVNVLANDLNADGGELAVKSVTQPGDGAVDITGGGTGLTYTPDADYCNDGSPTDTFEYTLNGGSTATVEMTVTCVVDPAVAVDDSGTVTEDDAATAVSVLANDKPGDTGPLSITSVSQPSNGLVVITGGGTGLTYKPKADYCNDGPPKDTFDYTINGGSTATVSMTVTCVEDAPTAVDDAETVTEDDAAFEVDVLGNDTDPDGGALSVDSVTQPANGTVNIIGGGTGLTYKPKADYCNDGSPTDDFTYTLNGGSTATVSMTVTCVDDSPTAVDDSASVAEDAAATAVDVLANDLNADGGELSVKSVTQAGNGAVVITGGGTGLTYEPAKDYCHSALTKDTFTYKLNGGSEATVSVLVTCSDDAPTAVDDSATVTEDDAATEVTVLTNDLNADGGPLSIDAVTQPANGTVAITGSGTGLTYKPNANYCNGGSPKDTFTYTLNGGSTATVSMTVTCVDDAPTAVDDAATVTEDDVAAPVSVLTNDLNADGGPLSIDAVTQPGNGIVVITGGGTGLTYKPDADYCNGGSPKDTFTYTLNGGSKATVSMTVTCENDPPTANDDTGTTDEDTTLTVSAAGVLTNDTDKDPGDTKTVVKLNGSTTLTGISAKGAVVTIAADGSYSYNPGDKFQGLSTGQSDTDSFTYTMADGGGAESTATVSLTINGVSDAPTANTDSFDAVGNTGLFVSVTRPTGQAGRVTAGSILANDTDPDTPAGELVVQAVSDAATVKGGSITINADGTFAYVPPAGVTSDTDSFTYRVCDATPCTASTVANSTGTLNLPIAGQVWYVDNTAAVNGGGTSAKPFDTLSEAEAASDTGDTTFVFDGNDTSNGLGGGYTMNASERLIGEVSGLTLDPDGAGSLGTFDLYPATPGKRPVLTASNEDVVTLASKVIVTGLGLDPSGTGGGLKGAAGVDAPTISDVTIDDTGIRGTKPGLELDGTTGTTNISNLSVSTNQATGVKLTNAGKVVFASTGTVSIVSAGAAGLDVSGTALTDSEFDSITVTGSGNGGVSLTNVTGPTGFRDLALTTTSGAAPAFAMSNAGSVTVPAAGTATLSATGGPAVDVTVSSGASLAFDSVSSTNSGNDGINIVGLGTGTFSATGGTITGAAGIAFDLDGGSGTVLYAGRIEDGSGASVEIAGRSGGVVTLSGRITDGNDVAGGIALTGNSGATVTLSGTVDLATGSSAAFTATGGGTVNVTNSDNTLVTTTGTALQVVNTAIGAGGMTFRSISATGDGNSNGASKGIVLDNTGSTAGLTVTGNGGTCTSGDTSGCSGGSIRYASGADDSSSSPVGTGIVLKNTKAPSLTRMLIQDASNYAIRGTDVSDFTLANSVIKGTNGTNGTTPFDDSAVRFVNLTGSAAITDTYVTGGREDNISVTNSAGNLERLTLTRVTVGLNSTTEGNDGIHLESTSSAGALKATIQDSDLTGARADLVDFSHNGSGDGDLVISQSDFSNNHQGIVTGGGGLTLSSNKTSGTTTMNIANNTFRNAVGAGVLIYKATGASSLNGTFDGNTIGVLNVANSGSEEGSGLKLQTVGQGTMTWAVTNNQIRGYNNNGIEVVAGGGATATSGNINTTITGNTIAQPGDTLGTAEIPKNGIHFNVGTTPGDTFAACAVLGGAGALANAISTSGKAAASGGADYDFRLRQRQATTFRLPGYGGGNSDNDAVVTHVAGRNGGDGAPLGQATNTVSTGGGGFTGGGTTCP